MISFILKLFNRYKAKMAIKELSSEEFESIKLKSRIALVDDDEVSHVRRLQKEGYNITDFHDIDEIDSFVKKKYHVVVLDIQGIGKSISSTSEGWGILRYLKKEHPHIVVIMFTGADWSITKYKELADMADYFVGKDLEYLDFKYTLDLAIRKAFSPEYHFNVEKKILSQEISSAETFEKIQTIIQRYGAKKRKVHKELNKLNISTKVVQSIDNYLSIIESITSLLD